MSFAIRGIGTAVPPHVIEQREAAELVAPLCCQTTEQQRQLVALYRRSGVRTRRSVLLNASTNSHPARQSFYPAPGQGVHGPTTAERMARYESDAGPLAARASAAALSEAEIGAASITHLVTVSCSGFVAPGLDLVLFRELGLRPDVARTHVGFMGCHGAINGLRVAQAFAEADPGAHVLVCAVELCSLHQQYGWRPDQIVANALFADGAAALVGSRTDAPVETSWSVVATASTLIPDSEDLMGWRIRDHGFEMTLSPRVPDVIRQHLRPWLQGWLAGHGLTVEEIGSWAVHPGGPRILQACGEAAGFERSLLSDSQEILAQYGNMSSPTVLFIVDRLRQRDAPRPCVLLAFGPGLAAEAALVR